MNDEPVPGGRQEEFLKELAQELQDPVHLRLLEAYKGENPQKSMEDELAKLLKEVLQNEA